MQIAAKTWAKYYKKNILGDIWISWIFKQWPSNTKCSLTSCHYFQALGPVARPNKQTQMYSPLVELVITEYKNVSPAKKSHVNWDNCLTETTFKGDTKTAPAASNLIWWQDLIVAFEKNSILCVLMLFNGCCSRERETGGGWSNYRQQSSVLFFRV